MNRQLSVLYDQIPIGMDRAVAREALADMLGLDDRTVRRLIHKLRMAHNEDGEAMPYAILSCSNGPVVGYWRSSDPDEIARYNAEVSSRAREVMLAWQRVSI